MIQGIGNRNGYRDQWQSSLQNDKVQQGEESDKTGQIWDAVFTDKKENGVSVDDFLSLMVAQLQNQDFMNPVDDTQYVTQLAQFATMQQMQEMATYMKTNYVMSLVGKNVTAAKFTISGELQKETGTVEKISLVNNEYTVFVNGKQFSLEQIMEINSSSSSDNQEDPGQKEYLLSLIDKTVTVQRRDKDGKPTEKLTGVVERISTEKGKYQVRVDGEWYPLSDVLEVGGIEGKPESKPESNPELKPESKPELKPEGGTQESEKLPETDNTQEAEKAPENELGKEENLESAPQLC